ncbi:hypothetical protein DITRI_Ditri19aG0026400 [Diplodiscus trichospermus]
MNTFDIKLEKRNVVLKHRQLCKIANQLRFVEREIKGYKQAFEREEIGIGEDEQEIGMIGVCESCKEIELLEVMLERGSCGLLDLKMMMEEVEAMKGQEKMMSIYGACRLFSPALKARCWLLQGVGKGVRPREEDGKGGGEGEKRKRKRKK